jgi:hypothetical protein
LDHIGRRGLFLAMMFTCLMALAVFALGRRRDRRAARQMPLAAEP